MSVMYLLVPLALLVVALAVAAYVWAARKGQFDDLKTPAMRMLHDDETSVVSRESREPDPPAHDSRLSPHD
jgi:cbb3-type cytochrome oxidase maturation protein